MFKHLTEWIKCSTLLAASQYWNLNNGIDAEETDIEINSVLADEKKNELKIVLTEKFQHFNTYVCYHIALLCHEILDYFKLSNPARWLAEYFNVHPCTKQETYLSWRQRQEPNSALLKIIVCKVLNFGQLCCRDLEIRLVNSVTLYKGADKSLARPTSRYILFDGENIPFDVSLVIYIKSTNIPTIMIINRIYETQIFCRCSLFPSWSG
jgi:hypothetical protein